MQFRSLRRARNSFGFSALLILAAALFAFAAASSTASAQVLVSVSVAPPVLPVYAQPVCPGPGYIWTPGYWAYTDDGGYYWVPGTWVEPPEVGFLWTPGYWGWNNNVYVWNAGYWGPEVGFYGGINYGFGYTGFGYAGGYWRDRQFYYNSRVNNVNVPSSTTSTRRTSSFTKRASAITAAMAVSARAPPPRRKNSPMNITSSAPRRKKSTPTRPARTAISSLPSTTAVPRSRPRPGPAISKAPTWSRRKPRPRNA